LRCKKSEGTPSVISEPVSLSMSRSERARPCSTTDRASAAYSSARPSSGAVVTGAFAAAAFAPAPPSAISASAAAASSKTSSVVARNVVRASSARRLPRLMVSMVESASR
jgi:hypothetical protein